MQRKCTYSEPLLLARHQVFFTRRSIVWRCAILASKRKLLIIRKYCYGNTFGTANQTILQETYLGGFHLIAKDILYFDYNMNLESVILHTY